MALSTDVVACAGFIKPSSTLLITASPCQMKVKISRGTSSATSHLTSRARSLRSGRRRPAKFWVVVTDIDAFTSFLKDHTRKQLLTPRCLPQITPCQVHSVRADQRDERPGSRSKWQR